MGECHLREYAIRLHFYLVTVNIFRVLYRHVYLSLYTLCLAKAGLGSLFGHILQYIIQTLYISLPHSNIFAEN